MRSLIVGVLLLVGTSPAAQAKRPAVPQRRAPVVKTENAYPIERHVRYSFGVRNPGPVLVRDAEVLAFAPVERTSMQRAGAITASQPFELRRDALGNQTMRFVVTLPPFASKVISVDAVVAFAQTPRPEELGTPQRFLQTEPFVQVDDPAIQRTAADLGGTKPIEIATGIERWVADHIQEGGYVARRRGARFALENGLGDCTERADLFVALARARGIPARTMAGFVVDHDAVVRAVSYHNWAEAYVDGTWRLADPDKGVWGTSPSQYLAMRILGGDAEQAVGVAAVSVSRPELAVRLD
jgi:transglutaminase-like putative cysteine protease